jgi:hypothetical protein
VVSAESQPGGFSPGSADRLLTADGRRVFVKAVSSRVNSEAGHIYRKEARVLPLLPDGLPIARLLATIEQDDWIALVLEDVGGRHPHLPWRDSELEAVLDALREIVAGPAPSELASALAPLPEELQSLFSGWTTVDASDLQPLPTPLADWCADQLDDLHRLAVEGLDAVAGDRLVHLDARADNLLIRPGGSVVVIDWPWAAIGAPWFDALTLLINVRLYDPGHDVDAALTHPVFADMPPGAVERVLAGMAGFFIPASLQPAPPGLPTLRTFQRDQGVATLEWLRQRMESGGGPS